MNQERIGMAAKETILNATHFSSNIQSTLRIREWYVRKMIVNKTMDLHICT